MANFYYNPQYGGQSPIMLTEQQWRAQLGRFFDDVDSIERAQNANQDSNWVRCPDGDYWIGSGAFIPPASTVSSPAQTTTSAEGDSEVDT